jgi:Arc/MetJ family transcription regulator
MAVNSVPLDTEVVAEVMRLSGTGSPRAAVEAALREYIHNRRRTEARVATHGHGPANVPDFEPVPRALADG